MKKKKFTAIMLACTLTVAMSVLAGCGGKEPAAERSRLTGTFTYSETVRKNRTTANPDDSEWDQDYTTALKIYGDKDAAQDGDMWCTVYPFTTIGASRVAYGIDQRLKLMRDFTYSYQYTITLTNLEEWGSAFASVSVEMSGTFEYLESAGADGVYTVNLSDPTSGTETIFGATVTRPADIYGWTLNSSATYVLDVATELLRDPDFAFNRFIKGRSVTVDRSGTDRVVYDDIFFADIMDDIAPYCDYTF